MGSAHCCCFSLREKGGHHTGAVQFLVGPVLISLGARCCGFTQCSLQVTWHNQLLTWHHGYLSVPDCLAASLSSSNAQAIAYALVGECVRLADEVVGSGGIKWGTLMNEGLILALFAVSPLTLL